jgi:hypothetical protein
MATSAPLSDEALGRATQGHRLPPLLPLFGLLLCKSQIVPDFDHAVEIVKNIIHDGDI